MPQSRSRRPSSRRDPRRDARRASARPSGARPARPRTPPPPPPGLRGAVERRSTRPLTALFRLPRYVLPLLTAVLLVVGLVAGGIVTVLCLLPLVVLVAWLTYLSWPRLSPGGRLLRLLLLGLLVGALVAALAAE